MGEFCHKCKKEMKYPEFAHGSDECFFDEIKTEKTIDDMSFRDNEEVILILEFNYFIFICLKMILHFISN